MRFKNRIKHYEINVDEGFRSYRSFYEKKKVLMKVVRRKGSQRLQR